MIRLSPNRRWALVSVLAATIPVAGVFTLSQVFYLRDLTLAFRSRFLFLRHTVFSGVWPLWDPYAGNGQAAVNDALYQLFHLPSLALRLLLPEIPAYNFWIALPVPLAALGAYIFLRSKVSPPAAAAGAIAFAAAGPVVSTTNFPNMSWSVAAVPFVFWTLERVFARRTPGSVAWLAIAVACQALAGEPVTLGTTLAIAAAYAALPERRWRDPRLVALCAIGLTTGVLLSAIQYVPMMLATRRSMRGAFAVTDFWAFHPLALAELVVPQFYGDYFTSQLQQLTWMVALNSGREPFYYTMYIGVPVVLAAAVAAMSRRPGTVFWTCTVVACGIASLGEHTPIYPVLTTVLPLLRGFRFPVKYLSVAAFGIATLAAMTVQWLLDRNVPRRPLRVVVTAACVAGIAAYGIVAWLLLAPGLPIRGFYELAAWVGVPSPIQGAEFLIFRARPLFTSLFIKLLAGAFLLWIAASTRPERRFALAAFVALGAVDLVFANAGVNPTIPVKALDTPAWIHQIPEGLHERVYVGGRLEGWVDMTDIDAPKYALDIDGFTELENRYVVLNQFMFYPSAYRVRESLSHDLPLLWPLEHAHAVGRFTAANREERLRFLERVGTRYVALPTPPLRGAVPLAGFVGAEQQHLYDFRPAARRAYIVPEALRGPNVRWQIEGLFQARFDPSSGVLVSETPPPPSGTPGPGVPASATFEEDGINRVIVRAGLPADGYLALLDTYDQNWKVDVDGRPAPLMRANGLFRAVHLASGTHVVTFTYRPAPFYLGAAITGAAALGLALWCAADARRRRAAGRAALATAS